MKKNINPILARLIAIIIFLSVFCLVYFLTPDHSNNTANREKNTAATTPTENTINPLPSSTLKNSTVLKTTNTTSSLQKPADNENIISIPENLTATFKTPDRTYTLHFQPTESLLDAMRQLTARSEQPFIFAGKEFPTLGFFVEEINGIKNDPQKNLYWTLYINGQAAKVGISTYLPTQNDLIEWKYENNTF